MYDFLSSLTAGDRGGSQIVCEFEVNFNTKLCDTRQLSYKVWSEKLWGKRFVGLYVVPILWGLFQQFRKGHFSQNNSISEHRDAIFLEPCGLFRYTT